MKLGNRCAVRQQPKLVVRENRRTSNLPADQRRIFVESVNNTLFGIAFFLDEV
jgi:hypothetical protein